MTTKTYRVLGMDCANCVRTVENGVAKLPGVRQVEVNLATTQMRIEGDAPLQTLRERVEALGYKLDDGLVGAVREPPLPDAQAAASGGVMAFARYALARRETQWALVGGAVVLLGLLLSLAHAPEALVNGLYILTTLAGVFPVIRSGVNNLRINHDFNMDMLMSIAAIGALLIGQYLEAATLVFLIAISEALEGFNADRARNSLRDLVNLSPGQATRLRRGTEPHPQPLPKHGEGRVISDEVGGTTPHPQPLPEFGEGRVISDGSAEVLPPGQNFISLDALMGREEVVPVEDLRPGDVILVKPGERIPMDGKVSAGESSVNQAPITGESVPARKTPGAEVFAGTINGEGALQIQVTRLAADNTLNRIIKLVEEAQSVRAPSQRWIDGFARVYTPVVVAIALVVALGPPLLLHAPFYNLPDGTQGWLYRALELLVIACPCALVLSTPVTVISAITAAARRGVLIKGGAYLEALGQVQVFAFDKTGTLTRGQPVVMVSRSVDCLTGETCELCDDVLALASAVERRSAHPLAQAVVAEAQRRGLNAVYAPAESVEALAGRGVQGRVEGKLVTVGSHSLFDAELPHAATLCGLVDTAEAQGQTAMLLSDGERVRGFIAVADSARHGSREAVEALRALGSKTVMLTGDNPVVAQAVARSVGVEDVRAGLLPADKVEAVKRLMADYGRVAMVGDGINDTPALAAAAVGVAMGGAGSAQALETADVALMADDLSQLPFAVRLSRFARRLIVQNVSLSLGVKVAFMLLALAGGATLWLAVFADMGMTLLVTANGMRAQKYQ